MRKKRKETEEVVRQERKKCNPNPSLVKSFIFSRVLRNSTPRFVGWSVCLLIGHILLSFMIFYHFYSLTLLLLPKWSGDLKYGPCPPARNFGSRVSGIVFSKSDLDTNLLMK